MKSMVIFAAVMAASLVSLGTRAAEPVRTSVEILEGSQQMAGLVWRCRNGDWGTFGNGCLKQRRKAKSKG